MHDLSPTQVRNICNTILAENDFEKLRSLFMIVDNDKITSLISFKKKNSSELKSVTIDTIDIEEFKNKLKKEISLIV